MASACFLNVHTLDENKLERHTLSNCTTLVPWCAFGYWRTYLECQLTKRLIKIWQRGLEPTAEMTISECAFLYSKASSQTTIVTQILSLTAIN